MDNDDSDEKIADLEFEKQIETLERSIKQQQTTSKTQILTVKMDKAAKLKFSGILFITMVVFEWILLITMLQVGLFPINYIMTPAGGYHVAGACFLILSFILNLRFQISNINENGKLSFLLSLVAAIFLLVSAFMSYNTPEIYSIFPTTVIIITIALELFVSFQFAQIVNKKSQ